MSRIIIITNFSILGQTLEKIFSGQGISCAHYTLPLEKDLPELVQDDVLIIQEPIFINNNYLSASLCWKNYLKLHSPMAILLNAGFGKAQDANYLDLLKLPVNAAEVLLHARKAEEEWMPVTTGGVDVAQKLNRFFEGHGDESVTDELHKMLRICKIARDELTVYGANFETVRAELLLPNKLPLKWNVLQGRWQFYMPYFEILPYFRDFEELGKLFYAVAPFFTNECSDENLFWETLCVERLEQLKNGLEKIENSYAR